MRKFRPASQVTCAHAKPVRETIERAKGPQVASAGQDVV